MNIIVIVGFIVERRGRPRPINATLAPIEIDSLLDFDRNRGFKRSKRKETVDRPRVEIECPAGVSLPGSDPRCRISATTSTLPRVDLVSRFSITILDYMYIYIYISRIQRSIVKDIEIDE